MQPSSRLSGVLLPSALEVELLKASLTTDCSVKKLRMVKEVFQQYVMPLFWLLMLERKSDCKS